MNGSSRIARFARSAPVVETSAMGRLLACVVLAGCASVDDVAFEVQANPAAIADARTVRVWIERGACGGARVYESSFLASGRGETVPVLEPGGYGVGAELRDAACRTIAQTCRNVSFPIEGATLALVAPTVSPSENCAGSCFEGRCPFVPPGCASVFDAELRACEDFEGTRPDPVLSGGGAVGPGDSTHLELTTTAAGDAYLELARPAGSREVVRLAGSLETTADLVLLRLDAASSTARLRATGGELFAEIEEGGTTRSESLGAIAIGVERCFEIAEVEDGVAFAAGAAAQALITGSLRDATRARFGIESGAMSASVRIDQIAWSASPRCIWR